MSVTDSASLLYKLVQVLKMNNYIQYHECHFFTLSSLSMSMSKSLSQKFPLHIKQ